MVDVNFAGEFLRRCRDLGHDVFLQALRSLAAMREASRFGPWLGAIARNRATDFHRRANPADSLDDQPGAAEALENPQREITIEDGMALLNAVRRLPNVYRETLIMRFVEGMTGPEIAAHTGLTHGSVRVNLHRGYVQQAVKNGEAAGRTRKKRKAHEKRLFMGRLRRA